MSRYNILIVSCVLDKCLHAKRMKVRILKKIPMRNLSFVVVVFLVCAKAKPFFFLSFKLFDPFFLNSSKYLTCMFIYFYFHAWLTPEGSRQFFFFFLFTMSIFFLASSETHWLFHFLVITRPSLINFCFFTPFYGVLNCNIFR